MQNSDSLGRLIARELRSGNRYHPCAACGTDKKPSSRTPEGDFCEDCLAADLMSDMIAVVGVEHMAAGENMTSQADEVLCAADNLASYLDTCMSITRRRKAGGPANG